MAPLDWAQYEVDEGIEKCSLLTAALTQLGLYVLLLLGYLNQLLFPPKVHAERNREVRHNGLYRYWGQMELPSAVSVVMRPHLLMNKNSGSVRNMSGEINCNHGYAPLYNSFEQFFSRYVYRRIRQCFNRPVCSRADAEITLKERVSDDYNWTFRFTGRELRCVNLGSYNYMGWPGSISDVETAARRYGLAMCSSQAELGSCQLHTELEAEIADFLGVEAAIVVGMGFAANTLLLPGLLQPGALVLSDENNHTSLIIGLRLARVTVRVFRHNDLRHLEQLARQARAEGCWEKIVIVMEGVYSMDGSVAALRGAVALKHQLGLHLYVDEAHSMGALGARGRGVTDEVGVDPRDVDVLMGTFSKGFRSSGGYIAGSLALVQNVRAHGHAHAYAQSMAPPAAAEALAALRDLRAAAGQARVAALRENTTFFRRRLRGMGLVTYGHSSSPVVPVLVYSFSKMAASVERLTERGVATVGVGFPATPLHKARIRFCVSADHTRAHLERALAAVDAVADELGLRYSRLPRLCDP